MADPVDAVALPRLLLVDDRPNNLMALEALLESLECEIVVAESGEEALQLLLSEEFDVILLDVQLPGLDGFEVAELIKQRERTRHIPLIFLTATTGNSTALRGYSAGAVDFVSKPFDPIVLRSKVAAFLELSKTSAQLRRQAGELAVMLAEREATAALLAKQAEELRQSNVELEHVAAVASHDLAEPLRVIAGYSDLLKDRCREWGDAEAEQIVAAIDRGIQRMQRLIDGILLYARAGAAVPQEGVDVAEIVAETLLGLEGLIDDRDATVHVADLPTVIYNRTQLAQVIQNLVSNAVKFVPPGRQPDVRISADRLDDGWQICVADNGMGVSDEEREKIFDSFGHRLAEDTTGGVGLAVCARIAERNGGRIDVTENPGGGSIFTFEIPDHRDASAAASPSEGQESANA